MKIIGGKHAGYLIRPPKNLQARPTTGIGKEALFNILNNKIYFEEIAVLDLFSGSGNIALEFASRGAQNVIAVDISPITFKFLTEVVADLKMENLTPIKGEAMRYLEHSTQTFDIIFADPPYAIQNIHKIVELVFERNLLNPNGLLIVEHDRHVRMPTENLLENRKYGQSSFSFYSSI